MKSHEEIDMEFSEKFSIKTSQNNLFCIKEKKNGVERTIWCGTYAECYGIYLLMAVYYRDGYTDSQLDNSSHEKCNRMDSRAATSKKG